MAQNLKQVELISNIKKIIRDNVYNSQKQIRTNFSDYLHEKLGYHYTYMANTFSKEEGISIQQFIINTKIERVKELLCHDKLTLTQVADMLHYSSVAHLSNQFKKEVGMNPSTYINSGDYFKDTLLKQTIVS